MRVRLMVLVMIGAIALLLGGVAGACTCTDRDGCGTALSCKGKSSGDACSPPKGGTCKAISGFSGPATCCCGCRRGNANSADCSGYAEVKASLTDLKEAGASCGKKAKAATKATAKAAATTVGQAEKACQKNKDAKEEAKVDATQKKFDKLDKKLDKLGVTAECKENLHALLEDLKVETENAGTGTEEPPTTTTTTTMPNPPGVSCNGAFTPVGGFANEVFYGFTCTDSGSPSPFDAFAIVVPGGREITNQIDPLSGFACSYQTFATMNDSRYCEGAVAYGTPIAGRLRTSPDPATGMGGLLRLYTSGSVAATYNITGP